MVKHLQMADTELSSLISEWASLNKRRLFAPNLIIILPLFSFIYLCQVLLQLLVIR